MNFFLYINRKLIIFFVLFLIFTFAIFVFYKQINLNNIKLENINNNFSDADISEPKFAINNESKKINISAAEGNFLSQDKVLLKDNVRLKPLEYLCEDMDIDMLEEIK